MAHGTYWGIMDMYDGGESIEAIKDEFPFPRVDFFDDFELFTTSYAVAIWEIGEMTDNILKEVKNVIDKGGCVKTWTEEYSVKMGKDRQKELDKVWSKISGENKKLRKRKMFGF